MVPGSRRSRVESRRSKVGFAERGARGAPRNCRSLFSSAAAPPALLRSKRTFDLRPSTFDRPRGITLIEIMVALVIAALLFSAATVGVGALLGTKAKSAATELSASLRALYDRSALMGKTCRMVFSLPAEDSGEPASYWAECAAGNITLRREEMEPGSPSRSEAKPAGQPQSADELLAEEEARVDRQATFAEFSDEILKKRSLPSSLKMEVWTRHQSTPITVGRAFLYFYPQGFTERAQVKVRQGSHVWTISVSPLSGKTEVVAEDLEIPRA